MNSSKRTSNVISDCRSCSSIELDPVFFLGYLPPVNQMHPIGTLPAEQPAYPAHWLQCRKCQLVQLSLDVDPEILFPKEYPYTSSTTKILRENFAELYQECQSLISLGKQDLVVDIGSNDGNLLSNFKGHTRVQGITPEEIGKLAVEKGIPTLFAYFGDEAVEQVMASQGQATLITATNVFAHIQGINGICESILKLLQPRGVFIVEIHYLIALLETLQFDTIYHEHLLYYSLHSLQYLLNRHGLEVFHAKRIPTHGGSLRVYSSRKGNYEVQSSVKDILEAEKAFGLGTEPLMKFKEQVVSTKLELLARLQQIKQEGKSIYGIGAPSRATTLVNYVGIDDGILDGILEIPGSYKIGKYLPGTLIPVLDESLLFENPPDYALLLSWHIADELIPKFRAKGYKGGFIVPLPQPRVIH